MFSRLKKISKIKCGFGVLIAVTFTTALYFLQLPDAVVYLAEEFGFYELSYTQTYLQRLHPRTLDDNFQNCLFSPLLGTSSTLKITDFGENAFQRKASKADKIRKISVYQGLQPLVDLLFTKFNISVVLLEPSVLYCMLSQAKKELLLARGFGLTSFSKSRQIITLGIRSHDASLLRQATPLSVLREHGYTVQFFKEPLPEWMVTQCSGSCSDTHFISHVFLKDLDLMFHMVVFYERNHFLWHAALGSLQDLPVEELFYIATNSAYENFTHVSLNFKDDRLSNINIPSNPDYFLFETMNSQFLECNQTIVSSFKKLNVTYDSNPLKASNRFKQQTALALQELKSLFYPFLMRFFMWSGTMLGWYRQCGLISYTSDVDFGAFASEVTDLDEILEFFNRSQYLKIKQRMGIVEIGLEFNTNCHGLRTDVFFMYPESNGTWYAGHRPSKKYYFKYHHPNFTLCSAELLGHKVLTPCDAEKNIASEYGANWMEPVSSWYYESSIKNRGPNIYWNDSMADKVLHDY